MKKNILSFGVLFFSFYLNSNAQGCSDAGFCTMDVFAPEGSLEQKTLKNQIAFGVNFGAADNDINVFGQYIEYKNSITGKMSLSAKLTSLSQSGNNISQFDVSDLYLNSVYKVNKNVALSLGFKIPLSDGNNQENDTALPMDYQASLGTFDLIIGTTYKIKNWKFVAAYQQPLNKNKNSYFRPFTLPEETTFFSTNEFNRAGDVLLRISRPFELSNKLIVTPSLLPIYHLANDEFTNQLGNIQEIDNSKGLTLNANAYLDYKLNNKSALQFSLGVPVKIRENRPDGLTRKFVAALEYSVKF